MKAKFVSSSCFFVVSSPDPANGIILSILRHFTHSTSILAQWNSKLATNCVDSYAGGEAFCFASFFAIFAAFAFKLLSMIEIEDMNGVVI